jgi:hypothetical protein
MACGSCPSCGNNTRTGRTAELRPTSVLMEWLAAFKPQAKAGTWHGSDSKADYKRLAAVAGKVAAMPEQDAVSVTMSAK